MSDLKVPKRRVIVATTLVDGSRREVTVFLAEAAPGHEGGERLSDLLNGANDVLLVGELRDLETMAIAIETAETGHLVFGTLHTNTAPSTVDRVIDQFPHERQEQIRMMLSESLKGVVSQTLCKRVGGGRAVALEILLCTSSVANLIREGKTFQIPSVMQTARGQGMVMLNDALLDLVKRGVVEPAEACRKAASKSELKALLERAGLPLGPAASTAG